MPEPEARLVFSGPTALARAWAGLEARGYWCTMGPAPAGASPCGLALVVRLRDMDAVRAALAAMDLSPAGVAEVPGVPLPGARV